MAKTKVSEFDVVASNNTDINSVNVAEGCPPSGINNAIREMASLLKKQEVGTDAMTSPDINGGTIDGATIGGSSGVTIGVSDGTVSAPSIKFTSDTNTGIYRGGTDILKFVTAGTDAITIDASQDVTLAGSLKFADSEKAIFGASSDLQIYHDGFNSIISEAGTGDIIIYTNGTAFQVDSSAGENMIYAAPNAHVQLFYNNEQKFTTTANGFDLGDATASVYTDLNIQGASTGNYGAYLGFVSGGTTFGKIARYGRIQGGTSNDFFITSDSTNNLIFGINNVEKAKLDTSGNLLVGQSIANTSAAGNIFTQTGKAYHIVTNDTALFVDRKSSDGQLVEFRRDQAVVGSIGVINSDRLYIGTPDGSQCAIRFDGDAQDILPSNASGTALDDAISLGDGGTRFKDLYLSGGVYLGGTGSANYLDDYEEGTWTPTASAGLTGFSILRAYYTKVGRLVEVNIYLGSLTGKDSNQVLLSGLPFTSSNGYATGSFESSTSGHMGLARVQSSTTNIIFYYPNATTSVRENYLGNDLGTHIILSIVYMTP